jgi:hypothetical protein
VKSFVASQLASCATGVGEDPVDYVDSAINTSLIYDGEQMHQNWKTPTGVGKCYKTVMMTPDGSSLTAFFKMK